MLRIAWLKWRAMLKATPYKVVSEPVFKLQFLGEPEGDVDYLKAELSEILSREGNTKTAYLSRVQYPGEDKVRIALFIDGNAPGKAMAKVIAAACVPLVHIDILFFEDLPPVILDKVHTLRSFYSANPNAR